MEQDYLSLVIGMLMPFSLTVPQHATAQPTVNISKNPAVLIPGILQTIDNQAILLQDKTIAGIAMPKGTRLVLPFDDNLDNAAKVDYFSEAIFPKPIVWQGISIRRIARSLEAFRDKSGEVTDNKKMSWGNRVTLQLTMPFTTNDFACRDELELQYYPNNDENSWAYNIDAKLSAPQYQFNMCRSAGQIFVSKDKKLSIDLPVNSRIFKNRLLGKQYAKGYWDTWTANDYDALQVGQLFTLKDYVDFDLNLDNKQLYQLYGDVSQSSSDCPLTTGSYVEWHSQQPDILNVYGTKNVQNCGRLKVKVMAKKPPRLEFMKLIVDKDTQ
ncbi:hypothetical protein [Acinetobacter sp. c3-l95]|uniref:hypothetical protein n=1 Tax=Acinetobacter sp. c3-l95 TaxID=3342804 RepID=UPI0035B7CD25